MVQIKDIPVSQRDRVDEDLLREPLEDHSNSPVGTGLKLASSPDMVDHQTADLLNHRGGNNHLHRINRQII